MPYFYPHGDHWSKEDNANCSVCKVAFVPTGKPAFSRTQPTSPPSQVNGTQVNGSTPSGPGTSSDGIKLQTIAKPTGETKPKSEQLPIYARKINENPRAKVNTGNVKTGDVKTGDIKTGDIKTGGETGTTKPSGTTVPQKDGPQTGTPETGTVQTETSKTGKPQNSEIQQKLVEARETLNAVLTRELNRLKDSPVDQKTRSGLVEQAIDIKNKIKAATTLKEITGLTLKIKQMAAAIPATPMELLERAYTPVRARATEIRQAKAVKGTEAAQTNVAYDVELIESALQNKEPKDVQQALELAQGLAEKISDYDAALLLAQRKMQITANNELLVGAVNRFKAVKDLPTEALEAKNYVLERLRKIGGANSGQSLEAVDEAIKLITEVKSGMQRFEAALLKAKTPTPGGSETTGTPKTGTPSTGTPSTGTQSTGKQPIVLPKEDQEAVALLKNSKREALASSANDALTSFQLIIAAGPAPQDKEKQAAYDKAVKGRELLLRDLRGGPLSGPSPGIKFDLAAKDIIAGYAAYPDLSSKALDMAQTAKHPEVLAAGVKTTGNLVDKKAFGSYSVSDLNDFATSALNLGSSMGGDYFDRMGKYYEEGRNKEKNIAYQEPIKTRSLKMTQLLGQSMVDDKGQLTVDGEFAKLRDTFHFHPDSLLNPRAGTLAGIEDFRNLCLDPKNKVEVQKILNGLGKEAPKPPTGTAANVVSKTLGKPSRDLAPFDQQKAVVTAMMTPLDQGQVGSCFATAPARKQRLTKPLEVMKDFAEITRTGTLTKGSGVNKMSVPAVKITATDENALMRSWEYTVTTMSACVTDGREKKRLTQCMFGDYGGTDRGLGLGTLGGDRGKIEKKINESFTFIYDSEVERGGGSDGSSSKGAFVLQSRTAGQNGTEVLTPITDKEKFNAALTKALVDELGKEKLGEIKKLLASPKFETAIKNGFKSGGMPWEWPGGGGSEDPTRILTGLKLEAKSLCEPEKTDPPEKKAEKLLSGMVEKLVPSGGRGTPPYASIGASGIHEMNALPTDLIDLKGETPKETSEKIKAMLIKPGEDIAATKLDKHRAAYLHAQLIAGMPETPPKTTPPGGLTPAQFKQFCLSQGIAKIKIDSLLLRQLKCPEKIIADTNWGSGQGHKYFVMAPAPDTGKLAMWQKDILSGEYTLATPDWLEAKWEYLG